MTEIAKGYGVPWQSAFTHNGEAESSPPEADDDGDGGDDGGVKVRRDHPACLGGIFLTYRR